MSTGMRETLLPSLIATLYARSLCALLGVMTAAAALWTPQAGTAPVLALLSGVCLGRIVVWWLPHQVDVAGETERSTHDARLPRQRMPKAVTPE